VSVNSKSPIKRAIADVAGPLADLATHDNAPQTALTLIPFGRIAGKLVAKCKNVRLFKIKLHGPHHKFGRLGKRKHIQGTTWRKGAKGSDKHLRIPYGPRYPRSSGIPPNKI
jgi:hypothetical protein